MRLPARLPLLVVASVWFAAVFAVIVWVWGLDPIAFASPDESLNRFAAALLRSTGRPFLALPFPDPEDLAHPRHWVSVGAYAIPSYAPVSIYYYGFLLRLGSAGLALGVAIQASAAAAFALGTARLLPPGRQWLALAAPILGYPAIYMLLRPWMNMALLLTCVCWAFFFWAGWRRGGGERALGLAMTFVGAAAAVRPDFAAYLFMVALLLGVAASPAEWKRVVALVLAAGVGAVALNLFLNWRVTGHPLLAAYQIAVARDASAEEARASSGAFGFIRQLLIPMGLPKPAMAVHFLKRYWLEMANIAGLTLAQLTLVPILLKKPRLVQVLHVVALAVMVCFMLSHMDQELAGAGDPTPWVHHSMPRYWSPLYLLAALPPLLFLGGTRNRWILTLGSAGVFAFAITSGYQISVNEAMSLAKLQTFEQHGVDNVHLFEKLIPKDAMIYSTAADKIFWSRWRVGTIAAPELTATSIHRATRARLAVFVLRVNLERAQFLALRGALKRRGLRMVKTSRRGILRITVLPGRG